MTSNSVPATISRTSNNRGSVPPGWQRAAMRFSFRSGRRRRRQTNLSCGAETTLTTTTRRHQTSQERRQELEETRLRILQQLAELEALEARLQEAEQKRQQRNVDLVEESLPPGEKVTNPAALDEPTCAICLEDFTTGDCCVQGANCRHGFHKDCIRLALGRSVTCPMCREYFLPKDATSDNSLE